MYVNFSFLKLESDLKLYSYKIKQFIYQKDAKNIKDKTNFE